MTSQPSKGPPWSWSYCWGKSEYPKKTTELPQFAAKLNHIMLYTSPWAGFELTTLMVIDTDCIGSYESKYNMITTTVVPSMVVMSSQYQEMPDARNVWRCSVKMRGDCWFCWYWWRWMNLSFIFWLMCLTPLSTISQLYRGSQFYWWGKSEYPKKTTELPQFAAKRIENESTFTLY
jgi:hypothetical protein